MVTTVPVRRVVLQPNVYSGMQQGMSQIIEAIRPTLGPLPRMVALSRADRSQPPELLDNGALIARRIIELPNRDADTGAMFVRHMLWRLYQEVGDGTVTAAVLFDAIFREGVRHVASGGDAMRLRRFLEQAQEAVQNEIAAQVQSITSVDALVSIAEANCHDPVLAQALGEIFNVIGPYGELQIVEGQRRELEVEYVEGMQWEGGLLAKSMLTGRALEIDHPAVLLTDLSIQNPRDLIPLLMQANHARIHQVVIVAAGISDAVTAMLASVSKTPDAFQVVPIKTPGSTAFDQAEALEDLAAVTGAQPIYKATGEALEAVTLEHFGHTEHLWVNRTHFGIIDHDPADEQRRDQQRARLQDTAGRATDPAIATRFEKRLGHLLGGSYNLRIGGVTPAEIEARKEYAKRAAAAVRSAIREGVVPGGGIALLACQNMLKCRLNATTDEDERAAYRILLHTVEAPTRTISANAGHNPTFILDQLRQTRGGFDVRTGEVVPLADYSIHDSANVVQAALRTAILSAALALTIDVIVHHKQPVTMTEP